MARDELDAIKWHAQKALDASHDAVVKVGASWVIKIIEENQRLEEHIEEMKIERALEKINE